MGSFLFINLRVLPILFALFGVISIIRRRFETKHLVINILLTLIIWWVFVIVLLFLFMIYVAQVEY